MSAARCWATVIIVLAVAIHFIVVTLFFGTGGKIPLQRSVVVELDSPNSTVFLYKWSGDQLNNTGVVDIEAFCSSPFQLNVDEQNTENEIEMLRDCYNEVTHQIDQESLNNFTIYVGATSDMRLLLLEDPLSGDRILKRIQAEFNRIANQSDKIDTRQVKVVDPEEEAGFLWISINHWLKNFINKAPTVGLIYLDDISSLMAYAEANVTLSEKAMNFALYGTNYTVTVKGDICAGLRETHVRQRIKLILDSNSSAEEVLDPCLADGQVDEILGKTLMDTPCSNLESNDSYIDQFTTYKFKGSQNFNTCVESIGELFHQPKCRSYFKNCPQLLDGQVPEDMKFHLLYQESKVFDDIDFTNITSEVFFSDKIYNMCQDSWIHINDVHAKSYLNDTKPVCYANVYLYTLLKNLYQFSDGNWDDITIDRKAQHLHWSLGYMIYNTTYLDPLEASKRLISWYILAAVDSVCVLLVVIGIVLCLKKRGNTIPNVKIY